MGRRQKDYRDLLSKVDLSDGVNKEEAVILAQNYIIDNGLDDFLDVSALRVVDDKKHHYGSRYWYLTFSTKPKVKLTQGLEWGVLIVDKKTGKVQYLGEGPS